MAEPTPAECALHCETVAGFARGYGMHFGITEETSEALDAAARHLREYAKMRELIDELPVVSLKPLVDEAGLTLWMRGAADAKRCILAELKRRAAAPTEEPKK